MENTATTITTNSESHRESIRSTLILRTVEVSDASAVAEATVSTWLQMSSLLTPVIGARGVDVIFRRSLYLTATSFPWLVVIWDQGSNAALLASLKLCLVGHSADEAIEAGYTLLLTFTELLSTLIGESLSRSILSPVWALQASVSEQETRS